MLRVVLVVALAAVAVQATSMARLQRKMMPHERIVGGDELVTVSDIIIYEDYDSFEHSGDVCLLILSAPLDLNAQVAPVDLPAQGQEFAEGSDAIVSGWGTLTSGGSSPDVLYSVTVPVVSPDACQEDYGVSSITPDMICAGAEGFDSCQGDSGGPMTCDGLSCGVVSWGRGCALAGYPGVYAKTSAFTDWIMDNMK
ncbi:hypothetical protein TCAL_10768 [Tigriopus californicus]|uniref:Peptidase S1 domain-containing protein n=1 Tax=Tigriopus californicus TaxID=6832 RepID=A0A553PSB9_TIGCA|nr:hypothetical protein TCAL_10768 [Tigriopus californicus]